MKFLFLVLLTLAAYAGVWSAGFVYDDGNWLPMVAPGVDLVQRVPGSAPWLLADWLGGGLPWAYHGLVLSLHLLNGWLLWRLLADKLSQNARLVVLALFWLHPLQVEAVAYVSGGIEVLLTTYVLVALTAFLTGTRGGTVIGLCAFGLALTLKLSALALLGLAPLVLLVLPEEAGTVALAIGLGFLFLGWPAIYLWIWQLHPHTSSLSYLLTLSAAVWHYLRLVVWPVGFTVEHPETSPLWGGLALAASVAVGYFTWVGRSVWPVPFYAWLWVVLWIAPRALAHADGNPLTAHHLYAPFLAVWLVAGSLVDHFTSKGFYGLQQSERL